MIKEVEHKYFEEIELYIETFSPLDQLRTLHYHMHIIISYNPSAFFHLFFSKQALHRLHRSHTYGI